MAWIRPGRERVLPWAVAISFAVHLAALAGMHLPAWLPLAAEPTTLTVQLLPGTAPAALPPPRPRLPPPAQVPLPRSPAASALAVAAPVSPAPPVPPVKETAAAEAPPSAPPAPPPVPASSAAALAVGSPPRFDAVYLNNPRPAYPALSRRLGEQGRVLLRVLVSGEGRAREVQVKEGSGFVRLDQAARAAVAGWRFVPARQGGDPVEAWVLVPISFSLD